MLLEYDCKILNMSELITEYFTCKICSQNYSLEHSETRDIPTTCNSCWLKIDIWQKYEDSDLNNGS